MVWIESCPEASVSLPFNERVLKLIHVAHTSLLVALTGSSVYLLNQHTLLPIASHSRTIDSITQHGKNFNIKTKHVSVNTAHLQKLSTINLFVQTDEDYLIIYSVLFNYSQSLYEITNSKNDQLLQTGLPLSHTAKKFSIAALLRSATKTIIQGGEKASVNLENIEHTNNSPLEDELGGFTIESAKVSVFKILKIKIGIEHYWLKQNSHSLIIFNESEPSTEEPSTEEPSTEEPSTEEPQPNGSSTTETATNGNDEGHDSFDHSIDHSHFQLINIQTFKNSIISLYDSDWYHDKSKITYINYNLFQNYFIFVNEDHEIWKLRFELQDNNEVKPIGTKLRSVLKTSKFKVSFNPQYDLALISTDDSLKVFKIDPLKDTLELVKDIKKIDFDNTHTTWSSCGTFFVVLDTSTGFWSVHSKFGSKSFDSQEVLDELEDREDENREFLRASRILISSNSTSLQLINLEQTKLYTINLLTQTFDRNVTFFDSNYLGVIFKNKSFIKFPILPKFKHIIRLSEKFNGANNKSSKSVNGELKISRSKFNQFSLTYGDHISISTPFASNSTVPDSSKKQEAGLASSNISGDINHILWFNFKNYYSDFMNIVNHFWFNDYLVLINRKYDEDYVSKDNAEFGADASDTDHLVDEIIVLNTTRSKFGLGGENFTFDSDLILWKYDFKTTFVTVDPIQISDSLTNVLILTRDHRLVIIELNDKKLIRSEIQEGEGKNYNIFIGVNKTIHLSTISTKLSLKDIVKSTMVNKVHFLFLLNTGELYLLKNQSAPSTPGTASPINALKPSNMYDLILISTSVEYFKSQTVRFPEQNIRYVHVFNGHRLLVFELNELIETAFDHTNKLSDGIESSEEAWESKPITVELHNYQPIEINTDDVSDSSLELVVLENQVLDKSASGGLIVKPKVSHTLILNDFIENDIIHKNGSIHDISNKYSLFKGYTYCLELLLNNYLTKDHEATPQVGAKHSGASTEELLKTLIDLIELHPQSENIFINCLRKIEIAYWTQFFSVLKTSPADFMNRLIEKGNVELCYNFLIVYLNFKKEDSPSDNVSAAKKGKSKTKVKNGKKNAAYLLNADDRKIIVKIMLMLDKSKRWDWCFELCRFIKLLEPSGDLLKEVQTALS